MAGGLLARTGGRLRFVAGEGCSCFPAAKARATPVDGEDAGRLPPGFGSSLAALQCLDNHHLGPRSTSKDICFGGYSATLSGCRPSAVICRSLWFKYIAVHPSGGPARDPAPLPAAPSRYNPLESQQDLPPKEVSAELLMGRTTAGYIMG